MPFVEADLEERRRAVDAGGVDEDVDGPEPRLDLVDGGPDGVRVARIDRTRRSPSRRPPEGGEPCLPSLHRTPEHRDRGACVG